jgi:hypothetical protein
MMFAPPQMPTFLSPAAARASSSAASIAPRLEPDVEHPLPDHDCPGRGIDLIHDRGVGIRLRVEPPVVKPVRIVPIPLPTRTFGPVMNPSSDIEISDVTLAITALLIALSARSGRGP